MKCKFCGTENPDSGEYCSVCRRKLDQQKMVARESFRRTGEFYGSTQSMIPKTKSMVPFAAGAILIINALLGIGGLTIFNLYVNEFFPEASSALTLTNLIFLLIAVFVLFGGVLAMMRRRWGVTLMACVASFFLVVVFGLFCAVLEALLSIAALVLLAQARREFTRSRKEQQRYPDL